MFFTLKYILIIVFAAIVVLIGPASHAQDGDIKEGKSMGAFSPPAPQVLAPQAETTIQDLVIPAGGNEPALVADTFGKKNVEQKIIQLEQKINQLIYLNAILLLLIIVTAGSFGIVKIRKKLL